MLQFAGMYYGCNVVGLRLPVFPSVSKQFNYFIGMSVYQKQCCQSSRKKMEFLKLNKQQVFLSPSVSLSLALRQCAWLSGLSTGCQARSVRPA